MAKRSNFERKEKDSYPTIDPRAVRALLPHLSPRTAFAEPCAGAGHLIRSLEEAGHSCMWATDIDDGLDALDLIESDLVACDFIITNPPWSRHLLHPMIEHFANLRPTWLLFDADWAHTAQAGHLLDRYCLRIVSVGRLIWQEGTKMQGKDNAAWYLFHHAKSGPTEFKGR